jgi:hypothetical protein
MIMRKLSMLHRGISSNLGLLVLSHADTCISVGHSLTAFRGTNTKT